MAVSRPSLVGGAACLPGAPAIALRAGPGFTRWQPSRGHLAPGGNRPTGTTPPRIRWRDLDRRVFQEVHIPRMGIRTDFISPSLPSLAEHPFSQGAEDPVEIPPGCAIVYFKSLFSGASGKSFRHIYDRWL
ncbi:hypothetical protein [Streptomyces sp. NPDC029041]|uniref:hypothetical protein n=1 Tax=Streptomyces sp. NPDC029041 TaxID=3155727 RepID=UPI00341195BB